MVLVLFFQSKAVRSNQCKKNLNLLRLFLDYTKVVASWALFCFWFLLMICPKILRFFADDCAMYNAIATPSDQIQLNLNLQKVNYWRSKWQVHLNAAKSVLMRVFRKKHILGWPYCIKEHKLASRGTKILGLNDNFRFKMEFAHRLRLCWGPQGVVETSEQPA